MYDDPRDTQWDWEDPDLEFDASGFTDDPFDPHHHSLEDSPDTFDTSAALEDDSVVAHSGDWIAPRWKTGAVANWASSIGHKGRILWARLTEPQDRRRWIVRGGFLFILLAVGWLVVSLLTSDSKLKFSVALNRANPRVSVGDKVVVNGEVCGEIVGIHYDGAAACELIVQIDSSQSGTLRNKSIFFVHKDTRFGAHLSVLKDQDENNPPLESGSVVHGEPSFQAAQKRYLTSMFSDN